MYDLKKMPQRSCIGCNLKKDKKELIRIVKNKEGQIQVDPTGKAAGRGAYLCNSVDCLEMAKKTKRLEKALETTIDEEIYEELRRVICGE